MLIVGQALVSEDVLAKRFQCAITSCKGACCVEGDAGAPLDEEELGIIEQELDAVKPFMSEQGLKLIAERGFSEQDPIDKDHVTACAPTGECVFVSYDEASGIAGCAIEKAYFDKKTWFRKPISCHLYPIRAKKYGEYMALNYHQWNICSAACTLGEENQVRVYEFLKEALTRKMGPSWYKELEVVARLWDEQKIQG